VIPRSREAVWTARGWPHGEKAATDFTATTLPATCHGASSFGESARWRTNGCTRTPRESLGWITRGRSLRGGTPCVHGAGLLRVYRRRALQGFSPSAGKLPRGKRRIVTTVRTATRPERHFRDSFITVAWPSRAPGHMVTPNAPCVTDRDRWPPPGQHAREHRRRLPF